MVEETVEDGVRRWCGCAPLHALTGAATKGGRKNFREDEEVFPLSGRIEDRCACHCKESDNLQILYIRFRTWTGGVEGKSGERAIELSRFIRRLSIPADVPMC